MLSVSYTGRIGRNGEIRSLKMIGFVEAGIPDNISRRNNNDDQTNQRAEHDPNPFEYLPHLYISTDKSTFCLPVRILPEPYILLKGHFEKKSGI